MWDFVLFTFPILDQEDMEVPLVVVLDPQDIDPQHMLEDMKVLLVLDQNGMESQLKDMEA